MANPRQVINPFSKNQDLFRRNTNNSRWVAVNLGDRNKQPQPWSGKIVQHNTPQKDFANFKDTFQPDTDVRDFPAHPAPNGSIGESSLKGSKSPEYKARHDSMFSVTGPSDFPHIKKSKENSNTARLPSTAFRSNQPEAEKIWWRQWLDDELNPSKNLPREQIEGKNNPNPGMSSQYHSAKLIHEIEPNSKREEDWQGFRNLKGKRKDARVVPEKWLNRTDTMPIEDSPFTTTNIAIEAMPSLQATLPLRQNQVYEIAQHEFQNHMVRTDSSLSDGGISRSSVEVLIGIDRSILPVVDANKPLPPIPVLQPDTNKPLPPIRVSQSASKKPQLMPDEGAYMAGIAGAGMPYPTRWEGGTHRAEGKQTASKESPSFRWFKSKTDKHSEKAHEALKAKISRPGPLMVGNECRKANVAAKCGGLRGFVATLTLPSRKDGPTLPNHNNQPARRPALLNSKQPSKQKKGKKPAKDDNKSRIDWREVLEKLTTSTAKWTPAKCVKRKQSDTSFKCRGLSSASSSVYLRVFEPSARCPACENPNVGLRGQEMVAEPLYTWMQDENNCI